MKHRFTPSTSIYVFSTIGIVTAIILIFSSIQSNQLYAKISCIILLLAIIYNMSQIPLYTIIESDQIIIKKVIGKKTSKDIKKVEPISRIVAAQSIRRFANGGLFFYDGKYWNPEIGDYRAFLLNYKEIALITTSKGEKLLIN